MGDFPTRFTTLSLLAELPFEAGRIINMFPARYGLFVLGSTNTLWYVYYTGKVEQYFPPAQSHSLH